MHDQIQDLGAVGTHFLHVPQTEVGSLAHRLGSALGVNVGNATALVKALHLVTCENPPQPRKGLLQPGVVSIKLPDGGMALLKHLLNDAVPPRRHLLKHDFKKWP